MLAIVLNLLVFTAVVRSWRALTNPKCVINCCSASKQANPDKEDYLTSLSSLDKFLFSRFALSVSKELQLPTPPRTYNDLIKEIDRFSRAPLVNSSLVSSRSKNMLVNLFPPGLLVAYKASFGKILPAFSAWMNTWVTWLTTQWLMGPSKVIDLEKSDGSVASDNCLLIEKCRFLETSGCIKTCINACKIPTQRFFYEEMGLAVALKPNLTDFSCRFEFGVMPLPTNEDASLQHPCLLSCGSKQISATDSVSINGVCWK
eukprot:gene34685-42002_t